MLHGLPAFVDYFRRLTDEHVGLATFQFGGSERVLRRRAEDLVYPLLWLGWPVVETLPDGNQRFSADLFFLRQADNEETDEDTALLDMYNVAHDFHQRLRRDANDGLFDYRGTAVFQPKFRSSLDNDAGYVMEADLTFGSFGCYDPQKFSG